MRPPLQLRAFTGEPRDAATARIRDAFGDAGAWITDARFYSGVCTVLAFEVACADLARLTDALAAAGLRLDEPSLAAVRARAGEGGDVAGSLNVTFTRGDPDLTHDVPKVPG